MGDVVMHTVNAVHTATLLTRGRFLFSHFKAKCHRKRLAAISVRTAEKEGMMVQRKICIRRIEMTNLV